MARLNESRSSPHEPTVISAMRIKLTTGSSQNHPVAPIASAATTTPADAAASPSMCRKAPRMLTSLSRPATKPSAVPTLITMPTSATMSTVLLATGSVLLMRRIASSAIAPTAIRSRHALPSAARMEKRRSPYVWRAVGLRRASIVAPHARMSPSTSPKLWPASAVSASECDRTPKITSVTTNARFRLMPTAKARS